MCLVLRTFQLEDVFTTLVSSIRMQLQDNNRPFCRYGGHIELIRFKEYYRMSRGMSTFRLYFRVLFGKFFLKVFL